MTSLVLKDKRALVAGSTKGIGFSIAKELADMGAGCTLISRNEIALKKAVALLPAPDNQNHDYLVADFSEPTQVKESVSSYFKNQTFQILINNTGGPPGGAILEATSEAFKKAFNQHLICNQILAQAVVPGMKKAKYGRIINIISTSVKIPIKNLGVSNTIRGAVASWAKTMSNELGAFGITVNNILPGYTNTDRLEGIIKNKMQKTGQSREEVEQKMKAAIPAGRFGQPEELAAVAGFLCSPKAGYVNGVSIPVDGGRTGSI